MDMQPQMRRFLIARLGNEADADDVVHEAFIKYQKAAKRGFIENPKALLFSIVRNHSLDLIRQNSRLKARESAYGEFRLGYVGGELIDPAPNAEDSVFGKQKAQRFASVVGQLSPRVRQAFMLHKIEEYSYADVAHQMGISKSTVEKHMITALRALSEALCQ